MTMWEMNKRWEQTVHRRKPHARPKSGKCKFNLPQFARENHTGTSHLKHQTGARSRSKLSPWSAGQSVKQASSHCAGNPK